MALVPILLVGCGAGQVKGTFPDDMSREDHLAAAEMDQAKAEAALDRYDPSDLRERASTGTLYNPTEVFKDRATRYKDLAERHRAAARKLDEFEAEQCRGATEEDKLESPIEAVTEEVQDIDGGVRVFLSENADVEKVLAAARCHRAHARARGWVGMEDCLLNIPDLKLTTAKNAHAIDIVGTGESSVAELRARAESMALR